MGVNLLFNTQEVSHKIKIILKFLKPVLYFKCKKFKIQNRFYAYKYRKDKERIRRIHP